VAVLLVNKGFFLSLAFGEALLSLESFDLWLRGFWASADAALLYHNNI